MSKKFWLSVLLFVISFLSICFILLSCNILKKSSSEKTSEGNLKKENLEKSDTSNGGSNYGKSKSSTEQFDWTKTTFHFPKDTSKNITNVYPSTIIYENGNGTKETQEKEFDSSWFKNAIKQIESKYDSTNKESIKESESKKSTTDWKLYAIIGLAALFFADKLTKFIPYKLKLEKK